MSERPSYSGRRGCGLYIGVWSMNSFLDSETLRERETQNGLPPFKVQSSPKVRANGSRKRRPLHSDYVLLEISPKPPASEMTLAMLPQGHHTEAQVLDSDTSDS
jgi:hypothetical protein